MTTDPETPTARALLEADAIMARYERASQHVIDLCDPRKPSVRWTMRVPAEPDRDSDLVIMDALKDIPVLLAALRRADEARVAEGLTVRGQCCTLEDSHPFHQPGHSTFLHRFIPAPRPPEPDPTAALVEALRGVTRLERRSPAHRGWYIDHSMDLMHDVGEPCQLGICEALALFAAIPEPAPVADGLVETFTGQGTWPCVCGHPKSDHYFGDMLGNDGRMHTWCQRNGIDHWVEDKCLDFTPTPPTDGAA